MSNNLNPLYEFSFKKIFANSSEKAAYKRALESKFFKMKLAFKEKALKSEAKRLEKYAKEIAELRKDNFSTTKKLAYGGLGLAGVKTIFGGDKPASDNDTSDKKKKKK